MYFFHLSQPGHRGTSQHRDALFFFIFHAKHGPNQFLNMLTNMQRVARSIKKIGDFTYVPRHMVFNAAHGKTPCQLGLDMATIAQLLAVFEPFWCSTTRKNGRLRSNGAIRRQLKKYLKHVYFWSSCPWSRKKLTQRLPSGCVHTLRELSPEPCETYMADWRRDVVPEDELAKAEGIYIEM